MVFNLREYHEKGLGRSLEGEWGMDVKLVAPGSGDEQTVRGQVLWDSTDENPSTGVEITMDRPVVTLRQSSLSPVPQDGENWGVWIPTSNVDPTLKLYILERPKRHGSIGMIRLYLTLPEQAEV